MTADPATPWLSGVRPAWLAEVTDWIEDRAADLRLGAITAIVSLKERPWSAVLEVRAEHGVYFFKAEGAGGRHEPALLIDLLPSWPQLVPEVFAADLDRRWLLMSDHGSPVRDADDPEDQLVALEGLLPVYARMQKASSGSVARYLSFGLPDRRMSLLPTEFESVVAQGAIGGEPLPPELRSSLIEVAPVFAEACRALGERPTSDALNHGDLHTGNVLVKNGAVRLIDWGDSSVTHPFIALFVTMSLAVTWLEGIDKKAAARRLRDAYLDAWGAEASLETFTLAMWVGHVERAFNWVHMLAESDAKDVSGWREGIVEILELFAERSALIDKPDAFLDAMVARPVG